MNKLKEIFNRCKRLWELSIQYDSNCAQEYYRINERFDKIERKLNKHTVVHADIGFRGEHQIIVIGQYHNKDYVRVFNVRNERFIDLINVLQEEERGAKRGRFDMPGAMQFEVVYDKERF